MKVYADAYEAAAKMVRIKDEFLPDRREHETYKFLFDEVFSKVFGKLLPLYKTNDFLKEDKNVETV